MDPHHLWGEKHFGSPSLRFEQLPEPSLPGFAQTKSSKAKCLGPSDFAVSVRKAWRFKLASHFSCWLPACSDRALGRKRLLGWRTILASRCLLRLSQSTPALPPLSAHLPTLCAPVRLSPTLCFRWSFEGQLKTLSDAASSRGTWSVAAQAATSAKLA